MKMRFAWLLLLAAATALAAEKTAAPAKAMDISEIDPNFKTAEVGGKPVQYVDVLKGGGPFRISGLPPRQPPPWYMSISGRLSDSFQSAGRKM